MTSDERGYGAKRLVAKFLMKKKTSFCETPATQS